MSEHWQTVSTPSAWPQPTSSGVGLASAPMAIPKMSSFDSSHAFRNTTNTDPITTTEWTTSWDIPTNQQQQKSRSFSSGKLDLMNGLHQYIGGPNNNAAAAPFSNKPLALNPIAPVTKSSSISSFGGNPPATAMNIPGKVSGKSMVKSNTLPYEYIPQASKSTPNVIGGSALNNTPPGFPPMMGNNGGENPSSLIYVGKSTSPLSIRKKSHSNTVSLSTTPTELNHVANMMSSMGLASEGMMSSSSSFDSNSSQQQQPVIEDELQKQNLYKTELCRSFAETGLCRYGLKCQFAHGAHELRPVMRHPKYKTEICKTFSATGNCSYGNRCRFIHQKGGISANNSSSAPNILADLHHAQQQQQQNAPSANSSANNVHSLLVNTNGSGSSSHNSSGSNSPVAHDVALWSNSWTAGATSTTLVGKKDFHSMFSASTGSIGIGSQQTMSLEMHQENERQRRLAFFQGLAN